MTNILMIIYAGYAFNDSLHRAIMLKVQLKKSFLTWALQLRWP